MDQDKLKIERFTKISDKDFLTHTVMGAVRVMLVVCFIGWGMTMLGLSMVTMVYSGGMRILIGATKNERGEKRHY